MSLLDGLKKVADSVGTLSNPIGAGISALGGIASTAMQNSANRDAIREQNEANRQMVESTNKTNLDIANANNAMQYRQFKENQDWNLAQWNRENMYNSPAMQVARLKSAGLNPAFVMGNGSMAEAGSLQSAPPNAPVSPTMTAPQDQAYTGDVSAYANNFATGLNAIMQARMVNSNIEKNANDVQIQRNIDLRNQDKHQFELQYLRELAKEKGYLGDIARQELAYRMASDGYRLAGLQNDIRMQKEQINNMQTQRIGYEIQNRMAEYQEAYMPQMQDAQLRQYYASIHEMNANVKLTLARADLTYEQKLHEVEKKAETIARKKGLDISNEQAKGLKNVIINTAKEELKQAKWNTEKARWDTIDAFMHSGRGYGSTDRPVGQLFVDTVDKFEKYTRKFGKNRIVGRF